MNMEDKATAKTWKKKPAAMVPGNMQRWMDMLVQARK